MMPGRESRAKKEHFRIDLMKPSLLETDWGIVLDITIDVRVVGSKLTAIHV